MDASNKFKKIIIRKARTHSQHLLQYSPFETTYIHQTPDTHWKLCQIRLNGTCICIKISNIILYVLVVSVKCVVCEIQLKKKIENKKIHK